ERARGPVVVEVHAFDGARQPLLGDELRDERVLVARERDAVDGDALCARVLEERSPATPDVEHVHAGAYPERVDRELELPPLRGGKVLVARREHAVRVRSRRIEPGEEELRR